MKHTNDVNDVEEGQNVNTLSEIEEYYKAREQQLLKKLHQQGAALAAAEQALKQLTENQKVSEDETARQRAAREQQLKDELYRDPLTGIYNRRYYEEVARKTIGPAGVALMDVDDFKICNDTYGHYAGDMALETAANAIHSCIRNTDRLIRYGGDEFLLVLPGIPSDILQAKLEQIRAAVQQAAVPGYSHFRLSLSIGGTMQSTTDPMENAVRRADRLMYQAKCRKNAVMVEVPGHDLAALEKLLQNKPQILLVDDSAMNRMILTEILELIKDKKVLVILNKADLAQVTTAEDIKKIINCETVTISAKQETGIEELEETVKNMFFNGEVKFNEDVYITSTRHKELLKKAENSLKLVLDGIDNMVSEDFLTIDLMAAYENLGLIIGEEIEDDLANRIFSKFCMGK